MAWLPGAYHHAQDFLDAGFAQAVRRRHKQLDLIFVDLEIEHVGDRSALDQLRSDVILPARTSGVSIWLGGISLGGLFALSYAASHPGEIDGLCLLAPYLGNRMLTTEIARIAGNCRVAAGRACGNRRRTPNMALYQVPRRRIGTLVPGFWGRRSILDGARAAGGNAAGRLCRREFRRPRVAHLGQVMGEFFGFTLRMSLAPQRWSPPPLLYASAAVHLGAAATILARPSLWPWALTALGANHLCLAGAGLWPRSQWLGPNWTRLPPRSGATARVAITIDDGPDPDVTPQVLSQLAEHRAQATFFCVGDRVARFADLAREIVDRGHAIENHSATAPAQFFRDGSAWYRVRDRARPRQHLPRDRQHPAVFSPARGAAQSLP